MPEGTEGYPGHGGETARLTQADLIGQIAGHKQKPRHDGGVFLTGDPAVQSSISLGQPSGFTTVAWIPFGPF